MEKREHWAHRKWQKQLISTGLINFQEAVEESATSSNSNHSSRPQKRIRVRNDNCISLNLVVEMFTVRW